MSRHWDGTSEYLSHAGDTLFTPTADIQLLVVCRIEDTGSYRNLVSFRAGSLGFELGVEDHWSGATYFHIFSGDGSDHLWEGYDINVNDFDQWVAVMVHIDGPGDLDWKAFSYNTRELTSESTSPGFTLDALTSGDDVRIGSGHTGGSTLTGDIFSVNYGVIATPLTDGEFRNWALRQGPVPGQRASWKLLGADPEADHSGNDLAMDVSVGTPAYSDNPPIGPLFSFDADEGTLGAAAAAAGSLVLPRSRGARLARVQSM